MLKFLVLWHRVLYVVNYVLSELCVYNSLIVHVNFRNAMLGFNHEFDIDEHVDLFNHNIELIRDASAYEYVKLSNSFKSLTGVFRLIFFVVRADIELFNTCVLIPKAIVEVLYLIVMLVIYGLIGVTCKLIAELLTKCQKIFSHEDMEETES